MPNISQERRDELSPVWDMSQERNLALTLLNQRFHFLLLLLALCVAGAVNAKSREVMVAVLAAGLVIALLQTRVIFLSQRRLDCILDIIEQDPTHPFTIVSKPFGQVRISRWVGYRIPVVCCAILTLGLLAAGVGWISPPGH